MSPKLLQVGKTSSNPPLKDFIDQPVVQDALRLLPELRTVGDDIRGWNPDIEESNYARTSALKNAIKSLTLSTRKLPSQKDSRFKTVSRLQRWLFNLRCAVYDKPTGDGLDHAKPLKQDFVGVDDMEVLEVLNQEKIRCWSLPGGPETDERKAVTENLSHFDRVRWRG